MKKIYPSVLLLCFAIALQAQHIVSISPSTIPSSGSFTITIVGHNTFFLTHPLTWVQLTQPNNSDGSIFNSSSVAVIDDNSATATFTVSNPKHGGYYNVSPFATGIYINTKTNGVFMTGIEPRRITSIEPYYGIASTLLTAHITGSEMHFMSSTGYPNIGYVRLTSQVDNSYINHSNITYIDSNDVDVDFNIPYNATNGFYNLNVDLQQYNQTNRSRFFTIVGGVPKRITSVSPNSSVKGDSVQMIVRVTGRNLTSQPVFSASLTSELTTYIFYIYSNGIVPIDSNHVRLKFFVPFTAPEGDYYLTLSGNPSLTKHYCFRIIPPNLTGRVYLDSDSNGVMNGAEHGLGGKKVLLLPDSIYSITDTQGKYFYYADPGNYTLQFVPDTDYTLTSSPSYNVLVLSTPQGGFDFGLKKLPTYEHSFFAYNSQMRCNTTVTSYWKIQNPEDVVHQGIVTLIHSPNLPVSSTSIPPDYVNGDTMVWNYTVNPMQTLTCYVYYLCPAAGQTIWYNYTDQIVNHQYHYAYSRVVQCSYDPNDKSVTPTEDSLHPATLNSEELTYNINFQNTGNDTAFLVTLEDTLNPFLDLATFQVVGSSHDMITNIDYHTRIVTFSFHNIMLPDSTTDELGSHGFARYKINAIQGIPDSTNVTNTAYIYFDWNPYVETNTVTSHLIYFLPPQAAFTTANTSICNLNCIDFSSMSSNSTSWQWLFPGAIPSSSTDENPQGICFVAEGTYAVTLIAANGFTSDTISIPNYLTVNPLPPPPTIYSINDTLYSSFDPLYTSYQWYDTTGLIVGATDSFYVPPFSGLFGVSVYNQFGCEAATTLPIILGIQEKALDDFSVFPNPADDKLFITSNLLNDEAVVEITNILGEKMLLVKPKKAHIKSQIEINVRNFSPGIYFVKFQNQNKTLEKRFVKN